ncbi:hypothetical protein CPR19092_LGOLGGFK_00684 [Companilactobacillus paralimentarius]|jgi:hypothetical protein
MRALFLYKTSKQRDIMIHFLIIEEMGVLKNEIKGLNCNDSEFICVNWLSKSAINT